MGRGCEVELGLGRSPTGRGLRSTAAGLFERGARGLSPVAADTPATRTEPIALAGDYHGAGVREHHVDAGEQITVDHDRSADELVEEGIDCPVGGTHVAAHGFTHRRCTDAHARCAKCEHRTADLAGAQRFERGARRVDVGHHDGGKRFAGRSLERSFPSFVDLDEIEQRADHAAHVAQPGCSGASTGFVERHGQRVGACVPRAVLGVGLAQHGPRACHVALGEVACAVGVVDFLAARVGGRVERRQLGLDAGELAFDRTQLVGVSRESLFEPRAFARRPLDRDAQRAELAADLGCLAARWRNPARPFVLKARACQVELDLGVGQPVELGQQCFGLELGGVEIDPQPGPVGFEVRNHTAIDGRAAVALDAPQTLGEDVRQTLGALTQRLEPQQRIADVVAALRRQLRLGVDDLGVELGQGGQHVVDLAGEIGAAVGAGGDAALQRFDLAAGSEDAQRGELGDEPAVTACRVGLAFQRAQLAPHLA
jgi:hypothetical protein